MYNILKISLVAASAAVILEDAGVAAAAAAAVAAVAVVVVVEVVKGTGNFPCSDFKKDIFVIY